MAADAEKMAPIYTAMDSQLAAPPLMHNVAFGSSGLKALLEGGIMQIVTVEGVSVGINGSEVRTIVAALIGSSTCRGVEIGEIVGDSKQEGADEVGKTFVVAIGWKGPVTEEGKTKRGAEWWSREGAKLGSGAKVEMHEVKFIKCF
jgi:hypothetical protein